LIQILRLVPIVITHSHGETLKALVGKPPSHGETIKALVESI
jgi:hypothetical protein